MGLILANGALGALFMPFLAITLLFLLFLLFRPSPGDVLGAQVPPQWRNGWLSNSLMALCAVLFIALRGQRADELLAPYVPLW